MLGRGPRGPRNAGGGRAHARSSLPLEGRLPNALAAGALQPLAAGALGPGWAARLLRAAASAASAYSSRVVWRLSRGPTPRHRAPLRRPQAGAARKCEKPGGGPGAHHRVPRSPSPGREVAGSLASGPAQEFQEAQDLLSGGEAVGRVGGRGQPPRVQAYVERRPGRGRPPGPRGLHGCSEDEGAGLASSVRPGKARRRRGR